MLRLALILSLLATPALACTTFTYVGSNGRLIVCTSCYGVTTCDGF